MVTSGGFIWSRYYILPLGAALFNGLFAGWSFWNYENESSSHSTLLSNIEGTASQTHHLKPSPPTIKSHFYSMTQAVRTKIVLLGAIFIFAYQGSEVSISGWVISFLISTRHGDPSSVGYVTAGFWGGITLGRFFLSQPAHILGEKISVYFIIAGAAAFQLLIWLVPNVIGDAVAVAIVGLLLGPVYPCATVIFSRAIPRKAQVSSLGVISAFGSSGGAVAPFLVGILAQLVGTFVLHPIAIALFAVMLGCWFAIPNVTKRTE
jgi:fucose permease